MKIKSLFLLLLVFTGCASVEVTSVVKNKDHKTYSRIMTFCIHSDEDFSCLDSSYFYTRFRKEFNDVDNLKNREVLEKVLKSSLQGESFPTVIKSSDSFDTDKFYDYDYFREVIRKNGPDALLIMNLRRSDSIHRCVEVEDDDLVSPEIYQEFQYTYFCYLVDSKDLDHYLWVGKVVVSGKDLSTNELTAQVGRTVARKLRKEKLVY